MSFKGSNAGSRYDRVTAGGSILLVLNVFSRLPISDCYTTGMTTHI